MSWGLLLWPLQIASYSQLFSFISNQTLVRRWTGRSGADDCRWEFSNKKSNLSQQFFLHLTKNTQFIVCSAVFFSSCLERASVSSCWHSVESFGLMLSYYSMSGFPVLEKPVNRSGPILVVSYSLKQGGWSEAAIIHVHSTNNNLIPVLDQGLIVNKSVWSASFISIYPHWWPDSMAICM